MRRADSAAPSLRRLLPKRELDDLLGAFGPLFPDATLSVLDLGGSTLAQVRPSGAAAHPEASWEGPLRLGTATVGTLRIELLGEPSGGLPSTESAKPAPECPTTVDPVTALAERAAAVTAVLEHALVAGALRRDLAAETLERYSELHLAYRLGEALAAGLDLERLPQLVLDEALRVVRSPAALLVLDEADGFSVAASIGVEPYDARVMAALFAARAAAAPGRSVIDVAAPDAGTRPRDGAEAPAEDALAVRLWAPLQAGERTLGGVLLLRPRGDAVFHAGDARLLAALAAQAGTYIENGRLQRAALEQARLARELQLASEVQSRLLPSELPDVGGWEVAAYWSAAREVGGDLYDVTLQGARLDLTVADVADKGMAAALFMALTRSVLRASAGVGRGPGEVVTRANALLCADASDGMFVTVAHAQLFPDGAVRYANGGHNPPLLLRADGRVESLGRTGILVAWDPEAHYGEAALMMSAGDALLLYTDGIVETRSVDGEAYGEERFERLAQALVRSCGSARDMVEHIRDELRQFAAGREPFDDATLLVARRGADADVRSIPAGDASATRSNA